MPYDAYLRKSVLKPLGLTETGSLIDAAPATLAAGCDPAPQPVFLRPGSGVEPGWLVGCGWVYSTPSDLARFLDAAAVGNFINGRDLAYGWSQDRHAGHTILNQEGRIPGYAAIASIDQTTHLKVVVASNIQSSAVNAIDRAVRTMIEGERIVPPPVQQFGAVPTEQLTSLVGAYALNTKAHLTVSIVAGNLTIANLDGMQLPLDSIGDGKFLFRPFDAKVTFDKGPGGVVSQIDWNGQFKLPRISP